MAAVEWHRPHMTGSRLSCEERSGSRRSCDERKERRGREPPQHHSQPRWVRADHPSLRIVRVWPVIQVRTPQSLVRAVPGGRPCCEAEFGGTVRWEGLWVRRTALRGCSEMRGRAERRRWRWEAGAYGAAGGGVEATQKTPYSLSLSLSRRSHPKDVHGRVNVRPRLPWTAPGGVRAGTCARPWWRRWRRWRRGQ